MTAATPYADCTALWVTGSDRGNAGMRRTWLLPFEKPRSLAVPRRCRTVRRRRWCRTVSRALTWQRPFGALAALAPAQIQLLPYQLEPAIAVLRYGHLRVLIADEVGLGKTIQAGAILAQLTAEEPDLRALVVCPAGLRGQWQVELEQKLGLSATVSDLEWLAHAERHLPAGVNPWGLPGIFIASVDLVKRAEVLRAIERLTWDVVLFDEAHALSPATARLAAARTLARASRRVLLLTATPPDGDPAHLAALEGLGALPGDGALLVFRRTRAEVGAGPRRRSCLLAVRLTAAERRMHRALDRYTTLLWTEAARRSDAAGRLLAILLRKRALSSASTLCSSLTRRAALMAGTASPESQLRLPLADEDPLDDLPDDDLLSAPGLEDADAERRLLDRLRRAAAAAATAESKIARLDRLLVRSGEAAIVFTEYRDTLARLASALGGHAPLQLHGGMLPQERERVCARFASRGGLLLATDAASEGLNLHHRCRLIVHFELPWNPIRLEQRAGRVDRLGQARRVHEVMLVARHTSERLVLAPLVRRLRARDHMTRVRSLSESEVAAAILGEDLAPRTESTREVTPPAHPFRDEAALEARWLLWRRTAPGRTSPPLGAPIVVLHERPAGGVVTVVLRVTRETADGRELEAVVVPLRLELDSASRLTTAEETARLARVLSTTVPEAITAAIRSQFARSPNPLRTWQQMLVALERRETEILQSAGTANLRLVQAGLFDRRAELEADDRQRFASAAEAHSQARLERLTASRILRIRTQILAVAAGEFLQS